MNKLKMLVVGLALGLMLTFGTGCNRIEPGWVGIKVNQAGSNKGVEEYPVLTGWVLYMPFMTKVYEYPSFQQNVIWCEAHTEGSPSDESISFNCKGGAAIQADVSMSGRFKTDKISYIFTKFRATPSTIIHTYLRNEVRDALGRIGATYDPMEIIGEKRSEFLDAIKKEVHAKVGDWWEVDYITFANKLKVDAKIETAINAIIAQKQQTQQSELKVKQSKAEADQKVAEADGESRSKMAIAEGEAKAILTKAEAQSKANEMMKASLDASVLQSIALAKWDGKLPSVTGGVIPFINVGNTNK